MGKYYRVVKDHPLWEIGAILKFHENHGSHGGYGAIADIWTKHEDFDNSDWWEGTDLVEKSDWFERVYEISVLGKAKYVSKEVAIDAYNKLYQGDNRGDKSAE